MVRDVNMSLTETNEKEDKILIRLYQIWMAGLTKMT